MSDECDTFNAYPRCAAARERDPGFVTDWPEAIKRCFERPGFLEGLANGVRSGGFPIIDGLMVSWSDWLVHHARASLAKEEEL